MNTHSEPVAAVPAKSDVSRHEINTHANALRCYIDGLSGDAFQGAIRALGSLREIIDRLAAPSPVAQAPAQAGEVVRELVSEQAEDDGLWFTATSASEAYLQQELRRLHAAIEALATQPLAAPVQQEAWKPTEDQILAAAEKAGLWPNTVHHWIGAFNRFFDALALATPPAHPVLAPVVREPLTEDEIADITAKVEESRIQLAHARHDDLVAFARAIEAAHGIQATTGEQSHG